uniref:Subtilisin n=1 Tax=Alexandrium catenella TaxID=2925 RepID=A0A7S1SD12_ALECA|mmetsp:Transcript_93611/g.248514  ORF Transcript_93611/g.248514 Transcript_93611/m.248514 type:complete len:169 (+) Transcript_93611:84-590(+)|eukprot:CAMPEP_0171190320 /NCGR_PEP_ID=MMETSP0790-20130122/18796_1 /TAXON_ID=2925 /ORGANISM="Alexandrium catenella, Strain OF101" /LENGTH=168 /DNA_ID=CAMNT_0011655449 /DNA_START=53 /DNA_END=559 /DNA_ORIENTATION=-
MARLLLSTCLSLTVAYGLHVPRSSSPSESVKEVIDSLDPFAMASATAMIRLGKEDASRAPEAWNGDRAKSLGVAGLSDGQFKAGVIVSSGVNRGQLHSEAASGYSGAKAQGVAPSSWRAGSAKANAGGWEVTSGANTQDGGVDWTKVKGSFGGGHADFKDLDLLPAKN